MNIKREKKVDASVLVTDDILFSLPWFYKTTRQLSLMLCRNENGNSIIYLI